MSITGQGAVLGDVVAITQGLPRMIAELQPAQEFQLAASWIGLAYIAGFVVMLAMHRRLLAVSDKRMVLGCALTVFAVGAAVAVAAPTWTILLTARAFQGGSAAIVVTACLPVLLSQLVDRQVQMLPLWAASTTIGALFIHAAGAWLVHTAGWRALLAPGLITATVTIFMLAAVPRPRRGKHLKPASANDQNADTVMLPRALLVELRSALVEVADSAEQSLPNHEAGPVAPSPLSPYVPYPARGLNGRRPALLPPSGDLHGQ
ncbi:MFS transporter [Streptosporangium lutulentum]|uniref:MFS family permease n=1 Tax=Streptosporangium lutulentum TaxID=1461250 RepID=A0ABT9QUF3_9ACTN|nr:MFS transporter [Streptosporangium lutulentum]MDP9850392.1 MFS family permease [Streptosporangium lutulentum]